MDLNKISILSDEQLVLLYRNPSTEGEIKKALLKEITLRELKEIKSQASDNGLEFTQNQKLSLIFLPFLYRYHRKIMFKDSWSPKLDKQFWNYITLGIIIYTILFLIGLLFRNR